MRSIWAVAAAATMLLAFPLAVVSQALGQNAPEIVVHIVLGTGMLLFAKAVWAFGLPRWINWVGALSAVAFGAIFLLQAVSLLVPQNAALDDVAFGLLGNWGERLCLLGIDAWFLGLLLLGTEGRTRLIGWAVVPIVAAYHLISLAGAILAIDIPNVRLAFFLPFVWLLIEGAKRGAPGALGPRPPDTDHVEVPTA
ncbi:MAG TPA: hypothetical protein VFP66_00620 [Candidatus Limnocylindrales bacterium]|nr:hypothetical protein [Candidatus Limnocylindrales bacterium]